TGIRANTAQVNERVRSWERAHPSVAAKAFERIGTLAALGEDALVAGDFKALGALMVQNHEVLRAIGVSCRKLEQLNKAALDAGAFGAKVAGSGGGGIMVAVADEARIDAVAAAIEAAGGRAFVTQGGS